MGRADLLRAICLMRGDSIIEGTSGSRLLGRETEYGASGDNRRRGQTRGAANQYQIAANLVLSILNQ